MKEKPVINLIEQALLNFGYNRSPNDATRWYANGPNILECAYDVHVRKTHIEILPKPWQSSRPVVLAAFVRPADFFAWLQRNGTISESGYRNLDWID